MPYVNQSRPLKGSLAYRRARWYINGQRQTMQTFTEDIAGSQTTYSYRSRRKGEEDYADYEGLTGEELHHRIFDEYHTRFDNGHEFSTQKQDFTYPGCEKVVLWRDDYIVPGTGKAGHLEYRGPLRPQGSAIPTFPTIVLPSNSTLELQGSKIIGYVVPTASEAAAATFLGEIYRDGLPKIPGLQSYRDKSLPYKKGSDEYLNYVFGVRPFKSDLQKMALAVKNATKILLQLRRDSDRVVRRSTKLDPTVTVTDKGTDSVSQSLLFLPGFNGASPPPMWSGLPSQRVTDIVNQQYSFSGAFTYHLAEAHSFLGKLEYYANQADHLLGIEINLETIWDLTRWSWLVDWFVDVGSFLNNVQLFHSNSLVMRYGYIMCHTTHTRQRTVRGLKAAALGGSSHDTLVSYATVEAKVRKRATPYGFGPTNANLTDAQWAIVSALGFSRAPKVLRRNE